MCPGRQIRESGHSPPRGIFPYGEGTEVPTRSTVPGLSHPGRRCAFLEGVRCSLGWFFYGFGTAQKRTPIPVRSMGSLPHSPLPGRVETSAVPIEATAELGSAPPSRPPTWLYRPKTVQHRGSSAIRQRFSRTPLLLCFTLTVFSARLSRRTLPTSTPIRLLRRASIWPIGSVRRFTFFRSPNVRPPQPVGPPGRLDRTTKAAWPQCGTSPNRLRWKRASLDLRPTFPNARRPAT